MSVLLNSIIGILILGYPLLVYFGLEHIPLPLFAGVMALLFAARYFAARYVVSSAFVAKRSSQHRFARLLLPLSVVMVCFAGAVWLINAPALLLYYPVLINLCLLAVFAWSLRHPPSMIEILARLREPELPESGVVYTRNVTKVWCFFFASTAASPPAQPYAAIYRNGPSTTDWCPTC